MRRSLPPVLLALVASACTTPPPPAEPQANSCREFVLVRATLYPTPEAEPLREATIRMRDGVVTEVSETAADAAALCTMDVAGHVVTAGYWNTHVHFTNPAFADDQQAPALIREMLLRYGFTSVLDTGADPQLVLRLRAQIEAERMPGPRIVVAGGSFVYRDGTPSYLPKGMLPELLDPESAPPQVATVLDRGADGIKIFSGSFQSPDHTIHLPTEIVSAVTQAAHARGAFVVSHPTDLQGVENAVDGGVDILAHTAPPAGKWSQELIARMKAGNVALTPTLHLWRWELERHGVPQAAVQSYVDNAVEQLRDYHAAGGQVLFGTDVGYMSNYDPTDEYVLMSKAGLDYRAILASLTVAPSRRFASARGGAGASGTVEAGSVADLVVLQGDPAADVRAFGDPLVTIRRGQVVYQKQ